MKKENPQTGKLRLEYNTDEDWYRYKEANSVLNTAKKNKVEYFDTEEQCIDRIKELKNK